ncbi:hypothetical protein V8C37DRAFT_403849 [Trichoderma ceciliae]
MANAWITTHGVGVIKDSENSFTVTIDGGDAYVRPTKATELTGIVHFTIPSPPKNNPNLAAVRVDFASQNAFVNTVAVFFANDEKFSHERLQKTSSFQIAIAAGSATYTEFGISVSVGIKFSNLDSSIIFQSVGVQIQ